MSQIGNSHLVVHQQAVKSMCVILQNKAIRKLTQVGFIMKEFIDNKLTNLMQSSMRGGKTITLDSNH